jgi:hypothetical protein
MGGDGSGRKPDPIKLLTSKGNSNTEIVNQGEQVLNIPNYSGVRKHLNDIGFSSGSSSSGVTTIAKSGSVGLSGAVTLSNSGAVTLYQVGQDIAIGATGGSPASPDKSIQFNDGGVFGGDSKLSFDKTGTSFIFGATHTNDGKNAGIFGGESSQITSTGSGAVILGGLGNQVTAKDAVVLGGQSNSAIGNFAVAIGGQGNIASGAYSLALGSRAKAFHDGTFVFGSRNDTTEFYSKADNEFLIKADHLGISRSGVIILRMTTADDENAQKLLIIKPTELKECVTTCMYVLRDYVSAQGEET